VFNITPYLKYHPGGVSELMRGAGVDATKLFMHVGSMASVVNNNGNYYTKFL
jgi:cytochrome b involved in lipid metabolism